MLICSMCNLASQVEICAFGLNFFMHDKHTLCDKFFYLFFCTIEPLYAKTKINGNAL